MSANWADSEVQELLTIQAKDRMNCHITGTVNNCFWDVIPLLLFRKDCLMYTSHTDLLHVTPLLLTGC